MTQTSKSSAEENRLTQNETANQPYASRIKKQINDTTHSVNHDLIGQYIN